MIETKQLGRVDYDTAWQLMRRFTDDRREDTPDAFWSCEHDPVYTLGQAGKREFIHDTGGIPIVQSDRGGQVTYHGPGQLVIYTLIDLRRRALGIRELVVRLENAVIALLADEAIVASGRRDAPGVYVDGAKVAALGLRVRRGCTYHGLSLNVDLDLAPFAGIDPCGMADLQVTSLRNLGVCASLTEVESSLLKHLQRQLVD